MQVRFIGFGGWGNHPVYEDEQGRLYFDILEGWSPTPALYTGARLDDFGEITGEPDRAVVGMVEFDTIYTRSRREFEYRLLSRLFTDCRYYVGCGGQCGESDLWASPGEMLHKMREILDSFKEGERPDWLSESEFETITKEMEKVSSGR